MPDKVTSTRPQIIQLLQAGEAITPAQISAAITVSYPTLYKHLNRLLEEGVIEKDGESPHVTYRIPRRLASMPNLEIFRDREWYHQRFDGTPQFISMIADSEVLAEDRAIPGNIPRWRICYFGNDKADWHIDQADIDAGSAATLKQLLADEQATLRFINQWQSDEASFETYFANFTPSHLTELSDLELAEEYQHFHQLSIKRLSSSATIDHFSLGTDQLLSDLLRQEYGQNLDEKAFNKIFSIATAPIYPSFINEAEASLLEIAVRVQQGELLESDVIQQLLTDHAERYFWLSNNYAKATILTAEYFEREIQAWLESGRNLLEELERLRTTSKRSLKAKQELFARKQPSSKLAHLIHTTEAFSRWQDERKRATYLCIHVGMTLLREMSSRRTIDANLLKYLVPLEVREWFLFNSIDRKELEQRRQGSAAIWTQGNVSIVSGTDAQALRTITDAGTDQATGGDIRGLVACSGKAIGRARILLSAEEVGKVEEGDILIAVMTRPDYVPAMRKAAAIVTNEGGITCHAAIVSRELGIPCIIATKVATKIFKDGDLIEVNANHNWVRKVSVN